MSTPTPGSTIVDAEGRPFPPLPPGSLLHGKQWSTERAAAWYNVAAVMPLLKKEKAAAIGWGFVSGRSQTIYPWDSWQQGCKSEPKVWFHDIFHADGTPYIPEEAAVIRSLTGR
jgi:hypothetical protein